MLFLNKIKSRHAEGRRNGFTSCYYRLHSVTTGPKASHGIIYKCNWKLGVWYFFHWDTTSPFHPSKSVIPRLFMPGWQSLAWPSVERSRSLLQTATTGGVLLSCKPLFFLDKKVRVLILIHRSQVWSYSVTSAEYSWSRPWASGQVRPGLQPFISSPWPFPVLMVCLSLSVPRTLVPTYSTAPLLFAECLYRFIVVLILW